MDPFRRSEAGSERSMLQWLFDKIGSSKISNYPDIFETGVILESLKKLKTATEADLRSPMKYIGLSLPVSCTDSQAAHILRAVERAGLIVRHLGVDALAASAAQGIGLCTHYADSSLCESEYLQLPSDDVLMLHYSQSALTGALASDIGLTLRWRTTVDSYFVDDALGTRHGSENGTVVWRYVTQRVAAFVRDSPRTVTRVILTGSSAREPEFRGAVEAAFDGLPCTIQEVSDPPFAAALGAAELAKRAMESPGPRQGPCLEPFRCKEIRDGVGDGFRSEL